MSYRLADIDVHEPLRDLSVPQGSTGLGLVVRRNRRPIGFLIERLPPGTVPAADLGKLLARRLGDKIVQECVREELTGSSQTTPLPSLTIAICSKDRTDNLRRCLDSLASLRMPAAMPRSRCEVLVVDNAPCDDRTRALVSGRPDVRYVLEPRPGLDFARNRALQCATGEIVAYLDDDVTVDAGWLEGLCEAYADNPDAAAFTGLVLPYELQTEAQVRFETRGGFGRGFAKLRHVAGADGDPDSLFPFGAGVFGAGCNMAFRRSVLLGLGGFDEALDTGQPLPGGGDLDAFYRVVRAGFVLAYEPAYLVFHQHRRSMEELRRQYRSWGLGFMAYVGKSYRADPAARSAFRALVCWWFMYMAGETRRALTAGDKRTAAMLRAELAGGIVGLFGEYGRSMKRVQRIRKQHP